MRATAVLLCLSLPLALAADPPDFQELLRKLGSAIPEERASAQRDLESAGEAARGPLETAKRESKDPQVAATATELLGKLDFERLIASEERARSGWLERASALPTSGPVDAWLDAAEQIATGRPNRGVAGNFGAAGQWACKELDRDWTAWVPLDDGYNVTGKTEVHGFLENHRDFGRLFPLIAAVRELPRLGDEGADPRAMMRFYEMFRAAGSEDAMASLKLLVTVRRREGNHGAAFFQRQLGTSGLYTACRILFDPAPGHDALRQPAIGAPDYEAAGHQPEWQRFPIFEQDGYLFMLPCGYCLFGVAELPEDYFEMCLATGRLRAAPLAPAGSPMTAIDHFFESSAWSSVRIRNDTPLGDFHRTALKHHLRVQALRATLGDGEELRSAQEKLAAKTDDERDQNWKTICASLEARHPRWNPASGRIDLDPPVK